MQPKVRIEIVGLIKDSNFQVAKFVAERLKQDFPDAFLDPKIQPLFEMDWIQYLQNKKKELRGEVWQYSSSVMCFLDNVLLGTDKHLSSWAKNQWNFTSNRPKTFYEALAQSEYTKHLQQTGHQFVYMDIEIAGEATGRLLCELFSDVCPKTAKNFEALCTGEKGVSQSGHTLCYKDSLFHRVVPNGWVQGGDISPERRGNGGESIYGRVFEDESFAVSHSKQGMLGMANRGAHTNGSQFYITLQPTKWMDKSYVAFGQVIEGIDVLKKLEEVPTSNEKPNCECKISDCGLINLS